jgi:lipopolysaccharide heptosyltransferase I
MYLPFFAMHSPFYGVSVACVQIFAYNHALMSDTWSNILLIKPSSLGDIVLALPALSALRRNFPNARITWMIRPEFAPLIEGHPHLDEIILFDRKRLGKAWRHPNAFAALMSLIAQLRRERFDAVLDLQGLFRTASLAWLSGCGQRFGPIWRREFAHFFYTTAVPVEPQWVHVVDYYMKIVETMGARDLAVEFLLPAKPDAAKSAAELLARNNISPGRYAVLIPGSAQASKCWPAERFGALSNRLARDHGLSIVATGSAAEAPMIDQISHHASSPIVNLAGQTSLPQLVEVLRSARIVISNDTGPGHIAAALGRPLVMMFSWSNPLRVGPYNRPECVVARDMSMRGLANKSTDPRHEIANITLDEVYERVVQQLDK